jgi:hypothetical protein
MATTMLLLFGGTLVAYAIAPQWRRRDPSESLLLEVLGASFASAFWAWACWFLLKRVARRVVLEGDQVEVSLNGGSFTIAKKQILRIYRPTSINLPLNRVSFDANDGTGVRSFWVISGQLDKL